jgi:hypothetical protein
MRKSFLKKIDWKSLEKFETFYFEEPPNERKLLKKFL